MPQFQVKEGITALSHGGQQYEVKDGMVEIPEHAFPHLEGHGVSNRPQQQGGAGGQGQGVGGSGQGQGAGGRPRLQQWSIKEDVVGKDRNGDDVDPHEMSREDLERYAQAARIRVRAGMKTRELRERVMDHLRDNAGSVPEGFVMYENEEGEQSQEG